MANRITVKWERVEGTSNDTYSSVPEIPGYRVVELLPATSELTSEFFTHWKFEAVYEEEVPPANRLYCKGCDCVVITETSGNPQVKEEDTHNVGTVFGTGKVSLYCRSCADLKELAGFTVFPCTDNARWVSDTITTKPNPFYPHEKK